MRRYLIAYGVWLGVVVAGAVAALSWYGHIQGVEWRDMFRLAGEQP